MLKKKKKTQFFSTKSHADLTLMQYPILQNPNYLIEISVYISHRDTATYYDVPNYRDTNNFSVFSCEVNVLC